MTDWVRFLAILKDDIKQLHKECIRARVTGDIFRAGSCYYDSLIECDSVLRAILDKIADLADDEKVPGFSQIESDLRYLACKICPVYRKLAGKCWGGLIPSESPTSFFLGRKVAITTPATLTTSDWRREGAS